MLIGKAWGTTETLLDTAMHAVHRLKIKPNARCSVHVHERKWNWFTVISGKLFIHVEKKDYNLTDITELGPGDFTTVRPGEYHQFVSGEEPVLALEGYYLERLGEDIIRKDVGRVAETGYGKTSTSGVAVPDRDAGQPRRGQAGTHPDRAARKRKDHKR